MGYKQFIVQFESHEETRWLYSDEDLIALLYHLAANAGRSQTEGPEPKVTIAPVLCGENLSLIGL